MSCAAPRVSSFARLSTYRARTFKSRHLPSSGPTHHLIAVHLPKLTACGLGAPRAAPANNTIADHTLQRPMHAARLCTPKHWRTRARDTPAAALFPIGNELACSGSSPNESVTIAIVRPGRTMSPPKLPTTISSRSAVLQGHGRGSAVHSANSRGGRQSGHHGR